MAAQSYIHSARAWRAAPRSRQHAASARRALRAARGHSQITDALHLGNFPAYPTRGHCDRLRCARASSIHVSVALSPSYVHSARARRAAAASRQQAASVRRAPRAARGRSQIADALHPGNFPAYPTRGHCDCVSCARSSSMRLSVARSPSYRPQKSLHWIGFGVYRSCR